jgi:hypothetical protein
MLYRDDTSIPVMVGTASLQIKSPTGEVVIISCFAVAAFTAISSFIN